MQVPKCWKFKTSKQTQSWISPINKIQLPKQELLLLAYLWRTTDGRSWTWRVSLHQSNVWRMRSENFQARVIETRISRMRESFDKVQVLQPTHAFEGNYISHKDVSSEKYCQTRIRLSYSWRSSSLRIARRRSI